MELLAFCLITLTVCVFAQPLGQRLSIIDKPQGTGGRKRHKRPTPLVGGLAVMLAAIGALFLSRAEGNMLAGPLILSGLSMLILGFLDDRSHIEPSWRLLTSIVCLWVVITWQPLYSLEFIRLSFYAEPVFLGGWAVPFSILCLVGLQNAVNMADGKNGLVVGMSLIWVVMLLLYNAGPNQLLLITIAGSLAVVMVFNLQDRLFLGDNGSYSISILIGLLAIGTHGLRFDSLPADAVALWFLVPVLDCLRLMVSRVVAGRAPFDPDRNHLHHLIGANMPWRYGLVVYLSMVGVPAFLAWLMPGLTLLFFVLAAVLYAAVFLFCGRRLENSSPDNAA